MESNGYASVARAISQDPDKETYIFRRFDRLTARNLLKLQGELLALQDELDALDAKAASSPDPDLHLSMRSWKAMKANAQSGQLRDGKEETKRLQLAEEIEVKLKKYRSFPRNELNLHMVSTWHQTHVPGIGKHFRYSQERNNDQTGLADKALILSQEAMKLESPDRRMLEAHRYALKDVALDERTKLEGAEHLVALKPPADKDILSQTLRSHWPFPSTAPSSYEPDKIQYFQERHLVRVISALSIFIAAVLIVGPILALNFTSSPSARLGIAITFIILFATGLGLSTGVSRDNIFVATATYSAVLVVFVSGNLGDVGGGAFGSSGNATAIS